MLASEERIGCVCMIVPINRCVSKAAAIDEIEVEIDVDRRNARKQS